MTKNDPITVESNHVVLGRHHMIPCDYFPPSRGGIAIRTGVLPFLLHLRSPTCLTVGFLRFVNKEMVKSVRLFLQRLPRGRRQVFNALVVRNRQLRPSGWGILHLFDVNRLDVRWCNKLVTTVLV